VRPAALSVVGAHETTKFVVKRRFSLYVMMPAGSQNMRKKGKGYGKNERKSVNVREPLDELCFSVFESSTSPFVCSLFFLPAGGPTPAILFGIFHGSAPTIGALNAYYRHQAPFFSINLFR